MLYVKVRHDKQFTVYLTVIVYTHSVFFITVRHYYINYIIYLIVTWNSLFCLYH